MKKFIKQYSLVFYPLVACVICSILLFGCTFKINRIRENYDYDSIQQVTGTVSAISISGNQFSLVVDFPDGKNTNLGERVGNPR